MTIAVKILFAIDKFQGETNDAECPKVIGSAINRVIGVLNIQKFHTDEISRLCQTELRQQFI